MKVQALVEFTYSDALVAGTVNRNDVVQATMDSLYKIYWTKDDPMMKNVVVVSCKEVPSDT